MFDAKGPASQDAPDEVLSVLNINELRTNATLRDDEWEELDERIIDVARQRLNGIQDLRNAGLIVRLGGLGTLISQYEKVSDMTAADQNMEGVTSGNEDKVTFTLISVPVPITHKDFRINLRQLEASRRLGDSLDTTMAQVASRLVADKLEETLFNGASGIVTNGSGVEGYTNATNRNTGSAVDSDGTGGAGWNLDPANAYDTVREMIQKAQSDNYFGPYWLYVSTIQYNELFKRFGDGTGDIAFETLSNFPELVQIKPADVLADGTVVLVQATSNVVDLAIATDIQTVEWSNSGGLERRFKIMAAMVPRVKSDANSQSGIVIYTGA